MEIELHSKITTYHFRDKQTSDRNATIKFSKINDPVQPNWRFDSVNFKTAENIYNLEDWYFLREVTNKIDELFAELNKK